MQEDKIADSIRRNLGKQCKAAGCCLPRTRVSSWCLKHDRVVRTYGHPDGSLIRPTDYKAESLETSNFIDHHIDHQGIRSALRWITEWLESTGTDDPEVVAKRDMGRLYQQGVDPVDILKTCAAVWLYATRYPHRLPDDNRLTVAISLAVMKAAPRVHRVAASGNVNPVVYQAEGRRMIGKRVRDVLGLLLVNIASTITALPSAKEQMKEDMSLPFQLSPTWVDQAGSAAPI
jgi:hypothetical protein